VTHARGHEQHVREWHRLILQAKRPRERCARVDTIMGVESRLPEVTKGGAHCDLVRHLDLLPRAYFLQVDHAVEHLAFNSVCKRLYFSRCILVCE